jgi:excisionase family DNA binding protein
MIRASIPDVLTLEELADYLRISAELASSQAASGQLPGRKIGDNWRFLRTAIDDWLRSQDARSVLLQQAGALADDENLMLLNDQIMKERLRAH